MMATPIRKNLAEASSLQSAVVDGLNAVKTSDRACIASSIRADFADSLDIDMAFAVSNAQENRWDYLLGHRGSGKIVALEPHSADDGEVAVVIEKRKKCRSQLRSHLKPGASVSDWFWVASGKVGFTALDKAKLRLDQNGVTFVGRQLLKKHLP